MSPALRPLTCCHARVSGLEAAFGLAVHVVLIRPHCSRHRRQMMPQKKAPVAARLTVRRSAPSAPLKTMS